jgi:hypothetical protein
MARANFEVRDPAAEGVLQEFGHYLKCACPPGFGFALWLFSFEGKELYYCSNAERQDMIRAMREFIAKYEAN